MPRNATGNVFEARCRWYARVSLGPKLRPAIALPTCADEEAATARGAILADLASKLRKAHVPTPSAKTLLEGAATAANGRPLDKVLNTIDLACKGKVPLLLDPSKPTTIEQLGKAWTSGELARDYPDHVKIRARARDDAANLARHVYPIVPNLPVAAFTLDHAEAIMRSIPVDRSATTRRNVALLLHRLLAMAVFPLRLLAAQPLPRGFLPKPGAQKAKGWIYPSEDRTLLGCETIPLCWRVLYGFLAREGLRFSEAAQLDVGDFDLVRGAVSLDKNKTDDPRAWGLSSGVAAALGAWLSLRGAPEPSAPMFVNEEGERMAEDRGERGRRQGGHHAARFREHLKAADVKRAALYERSAERLQVRLHDLRATFITIALANGRSETWVADRTGHKSSVMINRYRRAARTASELDLGELMPLDVAIPEFARAKPPGPAGGGGKRQRKRQRPPGKVTRRVRRPRRLASAIAFVSGTGGSARESNPPKTAELPRTDFEDRGWHQPTTRSRPPSITLARCRSAGRSCFRFCLYGGSG